MRVVIGSDHAGFDLKQSLIEDLKQQQHHEILDVGTHNHDPVDYPDFAEKVAEPVLQGAADRGILLCGSGVGASVAANKIPGVRAGLCHDVYSAHQGVEHDNMNVLVLGARVIGPATATELAHAFLAAQFSNEERHVRRLVKIKNIEARYAMQKEQCP